MRRERACSWRFHPLMTGVLAAILTHGEVRAGPVIVANPPVVIVGQVREGETEFVRAVFALRNRGDSPLRITAVRPGCRCTVTEYDSVIPPGGMGRLLQVVDIHGFPDGPFERSVTVASNAGNLPILTLPVRGMIRSHVEIASRRLQIPVGGHGSLSRPIGVRSDRSDLRLVEAVFTSDPNQPPWRPSYTLPLAGSLLPLRHNDQDGLTYYELRLWVDYPVRGDMPEGFCRIRLNHPRRGEIVCHASIRDAAEAPDLSAGPAE